MTINIHPTAIVDKDAILHDGVEIGAFSIIDKHVILGENTKVGHYTHITGHTTIGKNNTIMQAVVGQIPQDKKYDKEPTELIIGDNNVIREFATIHTGTIGGGGKTIVGNNNLIMTAVHIAHDCIVGNNIIMSNSVALGGHVRVGDWAILGGYSISHQFSVIGDHAMIGGGSVIASDIPPYITAMGNHAKPFGINIEGLKRRNFSLEQIENVKHAYKLLYRNNMLLNDAKKEILELSQTQEELKIFNTFFGYSSRGIAR